MLFNAPLHMKRGIAVMPSIDTARPKPPRLPHVSMIFIIIELMLLFAEVICRDERVSAFSE